MVAITKKSFTETNLIHATDYNYSWLACY